MSFFKKLFSSDKRSKAKDQSMESLSWIEPSDNTWHLKLLDLRPLTQNMLSTSTDPQMATNAVSYGAEDGTNFWNTPPNSQKHTFIDLSISVDRFLQPGVLFIPSTMEHKWAIYFDGENLIFIRSWLRQVFVVAKTTQKDSQLYIETATGEFTENESLAFTKAVLNYLLISHCINEVVPAPLPIDLESDTRSAGLWAFSAYGNMAHIGTFDEKFIATTTGKLRSHSLLHIAAARADVNEIERQIKNGADINALAGDGLASLQWSIANDSTEPLKKLLELGADSNVRSIQGATPIMNAVQANKIEHLQLLLKYGALVNAKDNRGFTALHRAAEMGHAEILQVLLSNGADKSVEAEGYTALSFAKARNNKEIIELLTV
jgi:hypothetical protein